MDSCHTFKSALQLYAAFGSFVPADQQAPVYIPSQRDRFGIKGFLHLKKTSLFREVVQYGLTSRIEPVYASERDLFDVQYWSDKLIPRW